MKCCMAGEMRHRITIQQRSLASDGIGGSTETWSTLATVWSKIEPMSAGQVAWASSLEHRVTHKITIRYRSDLTSDMRIQYGGRIFHVKGYRNLEERNLWTEINAEEGAPS